MTENQVERVKELVSVRCEPCARKYGRATKLGELIQWPNGQWAWHRATRRGMYEDRHIGINGEPTFTGVETKCRRCGKVSRFRPARLAKRRQDGRDIYI